MILPMLRVRFGIGRGASRAAYPRGALIVIHKSTWRNAVSESGSGLVREYCVSDAASSSDVPVFADKSAPTAEIVLAPDAHRDLCITMSAEHGHDQHTDGDRSSRSAWECLSGRSASALGCDVKRHGLDAHAKHHDQRARNQPKIFLKNTCMSDHELWSAALS